MWIWSSSHGFSSRRTRLITLDAVSMYFCGNLTNIYFILVVIVNIIFMQM